MATKSLLLQWIIEESLTGMGFENTVIPRGPSFAVLGSLMGNSPDPNFAVSVPTLGTQGQFCQCGLTACLYFLQSITLDQETYMYPL